MNETRVQQVRIDVDAETKRRIELAAAEKNVSVSEYLLTAARHQLVMDGILEPVDDEQSEFTQLVQDLRALRKGILAERNGELIDVDAFLNSVRDERDADLFDLR